jgi:hypothetical protein
MDQNGLRKQVNEEKVFRIYFKKRERGLGFASKIVPQAAVSLDWVSRTREEIAKLTSQTSAYEQHFLTDMGAGSRGHCRPTSKTGIRMLLIGPEST